ncbi:MAG TPA: aldo/keto reductase, partial [Candidatus Ozemobacteraceae bacterium]|nr:aldo/keto reductase [Candidatus Ozemobacteraceae bacterium]
MLYRTMPRSPEPLSILGFGCMRFPEKNGKIDEEAAERQIRRAIERGINYFDTAAVYHMGASEPFLGRVLKKDGLRDKVFLATKLPHWNAQSRADMDRLLDMQLQKLQTNRIDYYLVHNLTAPTWQRMHELGILDFLESAKRDGRIRYAGFSYHGDRDTFPRIVDAWNWDFCQIQYNFLDEQTQAGRAGLEYAARKNL